MKCEEKFISVKVERGERKTESASKRRQQRQTESPNLQTMPLQVRSCKTSCNTSKHKTKTACNNVSVYQYGNMTLQAKRQSSDLQVKNLQANLTGEEEYTGTSLTSTKVYYFLNGQRVAQRINNTLEYLHQDHLGSTILVTAMDWR